jgi:hypothetical protein
MERAWKKLDNSKTAVELEEQVKAMMKELGYDSHQTTIPNT